MRNTILHRVAVSDLLARVDSLSADKKPLWGKMSATEMLHHCNLANQRILSWNKPVLPGSLKQKALNFFVLQVFPGFPKNAKTAAQFETKSGLLIGNRKSRRKLPA